MEPKKDIASLAKALPGPASLRLPRSRNRQLHVFAGTQRDGTQRVSSERSFYLQTLMVPARDGDEARQPFEARSVYTISVSIPSDGIYMLTS